MVTRTALGMAKWMAATLVAVAAASMTTNAQAGMGLSQVPQAGDAPVTVFYPTDAQDGDIRRGPFTLRAAQDAPPARGNGHLVVISHGSGGNPWTHTDLARALVDGGFTVAMPEHFKDNAQDPSQPGPPSWKRRPAEVSRAIDVVLRDARFAALHANAVGVYGMSAGGHTALSMAGGRWAATRLRDHCEAYIAEDFQSCVGLATRLDGDALDGVKQKAALAVIRLRLDDATPQAHDDPRVRAVVAGVPFAVDFDMASLAHPRVALGIVQAQRDRWLVARFHSGAVLAACRPRCELLADLPTAGHGSLLSPPPPPQVLGPLLRELVGDPPGFDRAQMHDVDLRIAAFFRRHLLQAQP